MPTAKGFTRHGGTGDDPYTRVEDRFVVPSGATIQIDAGATATINGALNLNAATLTQSLNNALISIGDYDEQKEITMTASYIPFQINLASIANPTSGLTMGCAYLRADAATADQTNAQIVPLMVRSTLYFDVDSAYAIQSHLKIATSMATGVTHANIAAGSFKIDLDANVTQGNVEAGLFIMEGTGAVTEAVNVVHIMNESGTTVDSMLALTCSGTSTHGISMGSSTNGIYFSGTYTNGLNFNDATLTQSINNAFISIGDYDEQKEITLTSNYIPFQVNVASVANPGSGMSIGCAYLRADAATADQANAQIVPLLVRSTLYFDVDSAYAIQSHLKIATSMATGASHANIAAGSFKVDLDAAVTQGNVQAGLFVIDGDGAVTEESCVVQLSCESGATVDTYLECGGSGTVSHLFSAGSNLYVATADAAADAEGSIPIKVGGATKYIQYWPNPAAS